MGFANAEQLREAFLCGGMGFLLGLYYDVFRLSRLWLPPSTAVVFIQDIVYCISSAVVSFLFSLAVTDGQLRLFLPLGLAVGFFSYRRTLGLVTVRAVVRFRRLILRFSVFFREKVTAMVVRIKKHAKNLQKNKKKS